MTLSVALQRHKNIIDRVQSQSYLSVQNLCELLGVSEATVRRDLVELEAQGLLRRTHGGAVPVQPVTRDFSNEERLVRNAGEKVRIAKAAAQMVAEGEVVFLDAGTTTLQVAKALNERPDLTFITNGADIVTELTAQKVSRLFVVGGQYFDVTHGFAGPLTADAIRRFNVDKVFLSVSAVDLRRQTICISLPELAEAQRAMISIAQKVIVVADHSKFERSSLSVIAPLAEVDCIITDSATRSLVAELPPELAQKIIFA